MQARPQLSADPEKALLETVSDEGTGYYLLHILFAARQGRGCLPLHLGLGEETLAALMLRSFSDTQRWMLMQTEISAAVKERSETRLELMALRLDEQEELVALLESCRNPEVDPALSVIIATGCLGGDHLWRDLGFASRDYLSAMMAFAYPELKARNSKDMKWKRFLYKQLCETGGHYVCRAPSCEECAIYSDCFGPEV